MILTVSLIDEAEKLTEIRERIDALSWRDGRTTAGKAASTVKCNEQAVLTDAAGRALRQELKSEVENSPVVRAAALPRRFSQLMISRTRDGGHYGAHVDNAIMGSGSLRLRTDMSFTLFLTAPEEYEGGELVIHTAGMISQIKAKVGQLVLYPSSSIHEVNPVTSGERIVCVGWIESMISDQTQREILFDLENLRASLCDKLKPQSPEVLMLDKSVSNLLRMWSAV